MTVSAHTNTLLRNKEEDGMTPSFSFIDTLMELKIKKAILKSNFVAYGNIGEQTFYVQAPTPDGLDKKLSEIISCLYKKSS